MNRLHAAMIFWNARSEDDIVRRRFPLCASTFIVTSDVGVGTTEQGAARNQS